MSAEIPDQFTAVRISRGASYLIAQTLIYNGVLVVSFAILTRLVTPTEIGVWTVLTFLAGVCQTLVSLGFQPAATRYVAEEIANGRRQAAASIFYQSIRFTLLLATPVSIAVFLGAPVLSELLLGERGYSILIQIAALDILIYAGALPVLTGTLLGLQKFKESATINVVIGSIFRQGLILSLIIILKDFVGLVIGWVISDIATASILALYVVSNLGPPRFEFPLRRLLRFSWPLGFGNIASLAQSWFDRVLLVAFVPLATLGIYNATITAFTVLTGIANSMATALLPAYSAMGSDSRTIGRASAMGSRYACLVLAPLSLGLLATAKPALTLFVGQAYIEGTIPLMVLSGVFALTGLTAAALNPILLSLEKTKTSSLITVLSVTVGIASAISLLPFSGINGASVARGLAMIAGSAMIIIALKKYIQLRLTLKTIWKSLAGSGIMAVVVLVLQIPFYNKLLLPVYVLVGAGVYLLMLRLLKATTEDDLVLVGNYLGERSQIITKILRKVLL